MGNKPFATAYLNSKRSKLAILTFLCFGLLCTSPLTSESFGEATKSKGGLVSIGYAQLTEPSYMPGESDETWHAVSFGFGFYLFSKKTQFQLDIFLAFQKSIGTTKRRLVSGEIVTCDVSKGFWTVIPRIRQLLFYRIYGNIGYGMIDQSSSVDCGQNVIGGDGTSEPFPVWSWGADIRITDSLIIGFQNMEVLPKSGHENPGWQQLNIYLTVLI
jgi:hypothetical protein